jgi:hypothetical protein
MSNKKRTIYVISRNDLKSDRVDSVTAKVLVSHQALIKAWRSFSDEASDELREIGSKPYNLILLEANKDKLNRIATKLTKINMPFLTYFDEDYDDEFCALIAAFADETLKEFNSIIGGLPLLKVGETIINEVPDGVTF